jgi:MerR family transcriptional regulator, light-induced transcriptional regulator
MSDTTPIYNLKAVMNEVGLSASTLRAWELRYGLPKPQRTAGGHRLYSTRDIEMLKWLVERQKEGITISQAVEMWKVRELGEQNASMQAQAVLSEIKVGEDMLDQLREKWTEACMAFDDQAANRVLDQAFALAAADTVCTQVLQKGLARIGEGWYGGFISVQQEHFTSVIAIRRINTLLAAVAPPNQHKRILVACPPGEVHEFILLLITYLLRRRGWDVVYLGANVPLKDLDAAIDSARPSLVLSEAQTLNSAASLRTMSEFLFGQRIPLAFGGGLFVQNPSAITRITGSYLGSDISRLPQIIEQLLMTPPSILETEPLSAEYSRSLSKFLLNESFIVSYVRSAMQAVSIDPEHLEIANDNLTRLIYSAMILGDINLLDPSASWLKGLLRNYGITTGFVEQFYTIYRQAIERYLSEDGVVIRDWLSKQLSN